MKKVSLIIRDFGKERFLTFNIDNEADLDEELLDFMEDEEPKGIVPVIFEENEEFDTFSYNITDRIPLKELFQQEINAEMTLKVLRGLVLALINMMECRIPLSYLILNRNYIYIDADYKIDFICIPLEDMQDEVDLNGFLRNFLASMRFDSSENGDYVAQLLTYINNPAVFNLHNMVVLIEGLMSDRRIEIPEDDSVEIYAEYQEVEDQQEVLPEGDIYNEDTESIGATEPLGDVESIGETELFGDVESIGATELFGDVESIGDTERFEETGTIENIEPIQVTEPLENAEPIEDVAPIGDMEEFDDDIITVFGGNSSKYKAADRSENGTEGYAFDTKAVKEEESQVKESIEEVLEERISEENIEVVPEERISGENMEAVPKERISGENIEAVSEERISGGNIEDISEEKIPGENKEEILEEHVKAILQENPLEENIDETLKERIQEENIEKVSEERIPEQNEEELWEERIPEEGIRGKEPKSKKRKSVKEPKLKTKEDDVKGIVIEDDFDDFLAEQELKDKPFHFDENGLKIRKAIKVNRASVVQNTREELEEEKEDRETDVQIKEEDMKKTEEMPARNSKKISNGKKKVLPKVHPYLIRINTQDKMMVAKQNFKIGKSNMADYTVEGNSAVSRVHAIITNKDNEYFIKDNKSTNHTYVNGKMLQDGESELLTHDSRIMLGDEEFEFKLH